MQRIPRLEEVEWLDHSSWDESRPARSRKRVMEDAKEDCRLRTVGFVVGETRQKLVLSHEVDAWGRFGGSITIMKKLVISRTCLQPARVIKAKKGK